MQGPTLVQIKCVLGTPRPDSRGPVVQRHAYDDFFSARRDFLNRATPNRWENLLAASRRMHREWPKERKAAPTHQTATNSNRHQAIERLAKALRVKMTDLLE